MLVSTIPRVEGNGGILLATDCPVPTPSSSRNPPSLHSVHYTKAHTYVLASNTTIIVGSLNFIKLKYVANSMLVYCAWYIREKEIFMVEFPAAPFFAMAVFPVK